MSTAVTSSRLVGRSLELAQLQAALADAAAGQPSLAFVVGESGVGKSRLVTELQQRAATDGTRVLRGDCIELGDGELAYAPLVTALRPLVRDSDPVVAELPAGVRAELATLLPGLGETRERADGDQAAVFEALLAVLDGLSRTAPVLLVIEDLHWADASTRAFLRFLSATLASEPILLVATYRPDELHRRHPLRPLLAELERVRALRIDLAALSRNELGEQLADILGALPDPALVDRLYARAEGNPLFTEELLAAGLDGRGAVPPSLAAALALRIERLGEDAQEVVRVLSAGGQLDDTVLSEVAGLDRRALREGLREAMATQIVVLDGERYTLRHALLREAVHDDLLPGERAELHRALARSLEAHMTDAGRPSAQRAAAIAHHYLAAGDQPAALAAAVRAGVAAMEVHAYGEGATLFERALELWDRVPDAAPLAETDQVELLERAAECHFYADDLQRAVTLGNRALALVDTEAEPRRAAWLYGMLQRALWTLMRSDEADEALSRGLALLADDGPSPERAGLLARQARTLMLQSRYHRAVSVARRALAEQERLDQPGGRRLDESGALNALGVSLVATGEVEEGAAALRGALAIARERGNLQEVAAAAVNLRESLHRVGRSEEALAVAREAYAEVASLPLRQVWLSIGIAHVAFEIGDWDAAAAALADIDPRRLVRGNSELNACLIRAELALGRDERDTARAQLARAAELAVGSREPQYLGVLGALLAELATREGDVTAARAAVDEALDRIEFCSDDALRMAMVSAAGLTAEATAAQHARDLGDTAAVAAALGHAELLIARVRACADDGGALEHAYLDHAEADNCRALGTDQAGPWAQAATSWEALGRAYPAAVARWRQAEALVGAGDREGAVPLAAAAMQTAERLGAAWLAGELESLAARARLRLGELGDTAAVGDDESEDPFGLTPRERQVLALVAAGATNREIGRQLYMAEKTASVHVSRILSKLDVRSRTEAAGVAHRLGLDAVV
jgi:DNA-binding CsgD family transcriptional regulator/tetratricopeptide (TPR) repeat protein